MRKAIKMIIIISISIAFLTPVSLVIADDLEPPVISSITYGPAVGVCTDPGFVLFQSCTVTDNVSVADVRVNITGPVGFVTINESMILVANNSYSYEVENISLSGTYWFFIWAIDTSNNTVQSGNYHMIVFDAYLSSVYVDGNNTAGPWNGTEQYPLQYLTDAVTVLAENGTIFINDGIYENTSLVLTKNLHIVGENPSTTILEGDGSNTSEILTIAGGYSLSLTDLTFRNAFNGFHALNSTNSTITGCFFTQCSGSAIVLEYAANYLISACTLEGNNQGVYLINSSNNQFYHNNFLTNTIHVSQYQDTSTNAWDNGVTGNYWDNYRLLYPGATVIPAFGTWDTPYIVTVSGNNTDFHPWVYPSGYIDTIPPQITVLYPNGGEEIYGNITIQWSATDDMTTDLNGTIFIEYSSDNGNSWTPLASNQNNTGTYVWDITLVPNGNQYLIGVGTYDEFFNVGSDTSDSPFTINNFVPSIPQLNGPSQGGNGIPFTYSVLASDPRGEQIFYKWDWGDGNETNWLGPFTSNVTTTETYAWAQDGTYNIRVKAMNTGGTESNWSAPHLMIIAEQVNFSNVQLGHIYFKLFSFNRSFIFSDFLRRLGVVIILTSHPLELEAYATDIVEKVTFKAMNQLQIEDMEVSDEDGSDGFSCTMNLSRGPYILNITAYDGTGLLIDHYSLYTVFFVRIGRYATGAAGESRLVRLRSILPLHH